MRSVRRLLIFVVTVLLLSCTRAKIDVESFDAVFAPTTPELTSINPNSPSNVAEPIISGSSEPGNDIIVYSEQNCQGSKIAVGDVAGDGSFDLQTMELADGVYEISAKAINSAGLTSCSNNFLLYEVDTEEPTSTISPPSQTTTNSGTTIIYNVIYSEAVDASTDPNDYTIVNTGGASCSFDITKISDTEASFRFYNCLNDGNISFDIPAGTATDEVGNTNNTIASSAQFIVDNTGPSSGTPFPLSGDFSLLPENFQITFPENILGTSVEPSDFTITGTCDNISSITTSTVNDTLTINLPENLSCDLLENIEIELNLADITDLSGNPGSGTINVDFRYNNVGPTALSADPSGGTVSGIPSTITLESVQDLDPSSISVGDFSLGGSCSGVSVNSVSVNTNQIQLNLLGEGSCTDGENVSVTTDLTGIKDSFGNDGVGSSVVNYVNDITGPTVVGSPGSGTLTAIPDKVDLTFPADVNMDSLSLADFSLSGDCTGLALGVLNKSTNTASLNLSGANLCSHDDTVGVALDLSGVTDDAGNPGVGTENITFVLDTEGPAVTNTTTEGTLNTLPSTVDLTLSTDTDMTSVDLSDFSLSGTCTGAMLSSLSNTGNVVSVTLANTASCLNDQSIDLSLDLTAVTDLVGNAGVGSRSLSFLLDNVGPTANWLTTAGASLLVPAEVEVEFPEDTDMDSIDLSDFSLSGTCGAPGLTNLTKENKKVKLNVSNGNACGHAETLTVEVDLTGVSDETGNAGTGTSDLSWVIDLLGPSASFLTSTGNLNPLPSFVEIQFDADTDMDSIGLDDIQLSGTCALVEIDSITKVGQNLRIDLLNVGLCISLLGFTIDIDLTGVVDLLGNSGVGNLVGNLNFDDVAPIATPSISGGSYSVLPLSLDIDLTADTDMSSFSASNLSLGGTCVGASLGLITISGTTATVNLLNTSGCGIGSTLILTVDMTGVEDQTGNVSTGNVILTFLKIL